MYTELEPKPLDQESIKKANRDRVLDLLYKKRILTKQEASQLTDISFPTVSSNIDYLVEAGFAEEAGMADSTGGRKPVIYRFLPNARYSFGINIEPGAIRIIRTNLDIDIIDDFYLPYTRGQKDLDLNGLILASIRNIIEHNDLDRKHILGVGISSLGTVNPRHRVLEISPALEVKNVSFTPVSRELGVPVYLENEANAAALAELTLGIAKGMKNLIYISITRGVGAGMVIGGELYTGAHNRAGELGHQIICPGGKTCNCGKQGCWEQYVAEPILLQSYIKKRNGKTSNIKDFFNHLTYQDPEAVEVWEEYLGHLSLGIQNVISTYDPHYIVIGGTIASYPEHLLPLLMKKVFGDSSLYIKNDTFILTSQLGRNSAVLGAALLPVRSLLSLT